MPLPAYNFKYFTFSGYETCRDRVSYRIRLISDLGRKDISLGSNQICAVNLAVELDQMICDWISKGQPVEIDALRNHAKNKLEAERNKGRAKLKVIEKGDIQSLWEEYCIFHQKTGAWGETTQYTHKQTVGNIVRNCPHQRLEDKAKIVDFFFSDKNRSPETSKKRFEQLVSAIDWASRQGIVLRHWGLEYRDTLNSIKLGKEKGSSLVEDEESDVDIFKVSEVYTILNALKDETVVDAKHRGTHNQYFKYAYFCWLTGCRPSEAVALKCKNVDLVKKRIKFCEGQVQVSGRTVKKQGTKTVALRYFPINDELMKLLKSINTSKGHVFLNRHSKPISQSAFYRVWKNVLSKLGLRYRRPYQLRHTMISYHANNDYPLHKLAEIVGNSEDIIREHYLKLDIEKIRLPEIQR